MNSSTVVGLALAAVALGAVALLVAGPLAVGVSNAFGGTRVHEPLEWPWAAPAARASVFARRVDGHTTGVTTQWAWGTGRWRTEPIDATVARVGATLAASRAFASWEETGAEAEFYAGNAAGVEAGRYRVRVAPFQLHLVSIRPTVVLMRADASIVRMVQEHVKPGTQQREQPDTQQHEPQPDGSAFSRWMQSLPYLQVRQLWQLANPLHLGTQLPPGSGWQWFSPELQPEPVPLVLDEVAGGTVPLPGGALVLVPVASGWRVERR